MHSLPLLTNSMMTAAVARTLQQVVRPHIPSIKFPPRGAVEKISNSGKPAVIENVPLSSSLQSESVSLGTIDSSQLPMKYRRKALSNEEIEYIEVGGLCNISVF